MASGDGVIRRNHPILAVYAGDYPEQLLVTGIKSTSCPKCKVTKKDLGNPAAPLDDRNLEGVLQALALVDDDPLGFARACKQNGIKLVVHPFWEDLPYLHSFLHYVSMIKLFGTTDNYNTEYTERLHIDLAKDAYRATNHKDEYVQMTIWLERKEKILWHEKFVQWQELAVETLSTLVDRQVILPAVALERQVKMTKHPTVRSVAISRLIRDYGAKHFNIALAHFAVRLLHPDLRTNRLIEEKASQMDIYFNSVPVYHTAKFIAQYPAQEVIPARFDTALIRDSDTTTTGDNLKDYRVGRVRVIFSIPERSILGLFHGLKPPRYLAYIEWFTPFRQAPEPDHGLYQLKRAYSSDGERLVSVVPLLSIQQSAHLFPHFPEQVPHGWASHNVLDTCSRFFLNSQTDRYGFVRLQ
ncbi:hypothetical protein BD779DRAFT_1684565 [Infundibulicybe gibba]|nr:hypothetical protein BD779DRAFT_1684565 [Infundibulicybe gibba]